jgi:hypothetical protein
MSVFCLCGPVGSGEVLDIQCPVNAMDVIDSVPLDAHPVGFGTVSCFRLSSPLPPAALMTPKQSGKPTQQRQPWDELGLRAIGLRMAVS